MKQSVAILDFGTSKITAMVGSRGLNNSICVDGVGVCDYDGLADGHFLAPEKLGAVINRAITAAENSARVKINKLYIGVPGDFLTCGVADAAISLGKKRRVLDRDVDALHELGNEHKDDPYRTVINIQPIYYTLDDDHKLIAPVGLSSTRLGGSISYVLCDNEFIKTVDAAVAAAGVNETEYVASSLAEVLFLFDDYKRDNCVMLADTGALGTTFTIARGDGIARQYFFSWGGERITIALAEAFEIPLAMAAALKRSVILSLNPDYKPEDDEPCIVRTEYKVEAGGEEASFDMAAVNNIVEAELMLFARYIDRALSDCDYEFPEFTALSVTGGGLNIRGATEFVSKCLNRDVEMVKPAQPLWDKPQLSSALGLMDMVLTSEAEFSGFFGKLRRWAYRRQSGK